MCVCYGVTGYLRLGYAVCSYFEIPYASQYSALLACQPYHPFYRARPCSVRQSMQCGLEIHASSSLDSLASDCSSLLCDFEGFIDINRFI
jgi:hypothetical protein